MFTKQISIFVENKTGRLYEISDILGQNGIDIGAFTISDTTDFGILRIIVTDCDKAVAALSEKGFTTSVTSVLSIEISDVPGSLSNVLKTLMENNVGVEYMYPFVKQNGKGKIIIKPSDMQKAAELLKDLICNI